MNVRREAIDLLEENIGSKFLDTGIKDAFSELDTRNRNKSKNKQVRLHQSKTLLCSKGNHEQNEKATY